jgi:HEAT repeat protein
MKWLSLAVGLGILGFAVNKFYLEPQKVAQQAALEPPPVPPEPPPVEEAPPPVLDEKAMEKIRLSTKDSTPSVRWEAVNLIVTSGHPEADQFLFEMLQRDTEPELRLRAVDALKARPGEDVSRAMMKGLKDSEPEVRLAVLEALSQREDIDASRPISELVGDSDERVRLAAIRTLNVLNERRENKKREAAARNQQAQAEYQEKVRQYQEAQQKKAGSR